MEGWSEVRLSEVCEFRRGLTYSKKDEVEQSSQAVLRATNISLETGALDLSEIRYVADSLSIPRSKKVLPGTLIVCTASGSKQHLGKAALIEEDINFAFGGFMGLIVPDGRVSPKFLFWLMRSSQYWTFIDGLADGANINNLKFSQLGGFRFCLPSLEEQRRIVAVLDEAFEGLARASANAEANLQNARELYSLTAQEILARHTDGNKLVKLRAVAEFRNGLNFSQSSSGQVVKVVGVGDFQDNFWVPQSSLKTVQIEGELDPVDQLQAGDLLAVRSNGNRELIGRIMLAGPTGQHVAHSGFTIRIRSTSDQLVPEYLCHFLKSGAIREKLVSGGGGANISNLNQGLLGDLDVRVPSPAIQKRMIRDLDDLAGRFERLREMYTEKQSGLCCLRQSVLEKAFAGELT